MGPPNTGGSSVRDNGMPLSSIGGGGLIGPRSGRTRVASNGAMSSLGHGVSGFGGYGGPGAVGKGRGGEYGNWRPDVSAQMDELETRFRLLFSSLETRIQGIESTTKYLGNRVQDVVGDADKMQRCR